MSEQKKEVKTEVRVILSGEMEQRYKAVRKRLGLENDSDILRLLITQEYERIQGGRT